MLKDRRGVYWGWDLQERQEDKTLELVPLTTIKEETSLELKEEDFAEMEEEIVLYGSAIGMRGRVFTLP